MHYCPGFSLDIRTLALHLLILYGSCASASSEKWQAPPVTCGSHTGFGSTSRVVSVADLHGDWTHAVEHLTALGILANGQWAGGSATFVFTGDMVDRGDHGKALWELMFQLQDEAPHDGGRVVLLLGNHELMNLLGDERYVSSGDYLTYGGTDERARSWAPTGQLGRQLRSRCKAAAMVADVVYVHAGLLPVTLSKFAPGLVGQQALEALNLRVSELLKSENTEESESLLFGEDGPFWTRDFALRSEADVCPLLEQTLGILGARRMVVGHTGQWDGDVRTRCGGRFILADTLMSEAYTRNDSESQRRLSAVEFYGDSHTTAAVYSKRHGEHCVELPLVALAEGCKETAEGLVFSNDLLKTTANL